MTFLVWNGIKKKYTDLKIQYAEKYDIDKMHEEIVKYEAENVKLIVNKFENLYARIKEKIWQLKDKYCQQVYGTFKPLKINLENL